MQNHSINIRLLIEGCRNANSGSQRKLYEHFYGYGMSICLRYAKNETEAEEILNDSFLRIFNNLNKYDPAFSFKAWLRRILINTAIDYYRKYQKHRMTFGKDELPTDILDTSPLPNLDSNADVLPIIQELPPQYRMVFNLYVMEDYKHHEIAELLGISVGTSKSNLARAKEKLRTLWQQNNPKQSKTNKA